MDELHVTAVRKYAEEYKLDPALVCAVCEQESSWDEFADRYEPAFYDRYIKPLIASGIVHSATEAKDRATSYGLMQVMGQVARENGFLGKYLTRLCSPEVGLKFGCKVLRNKIDKAGGDIAAGLLRYNGGGNPNYAAEVMARIPKYKEGS